MEQSPTMAELEKLAAKARADEDAKAADAIRRMAEKPTMPTRLSEAGAQKREADRRSKLQEEFGRYKQRIEGGEILSDPDYERLKEVRKALGIPVDQG